MKINIWIFIQLIMLDLIKTKEKILVYVSSKSQFPDKDDYQFMFENQHNMAIKFGAFTNSKILYECMFVSIYSSKYREINFYFCFGSEQPHIITQSHMMRKAQSLESLSSFRSDPTQSRLSLSRITNLKRFTEYYSLLNKYTSDVSLRKSLFTTISQIKSRNQSRPLLPSSQCSLPSKTRLENANKKRLSIEASKRVKNLNFLKTNELLRRKREAEAEERRKERMRRRWAKEFRVIMGLKDIWRKTKELVDRRIKERDKVQKAYRVCIGVFMVSRRYFRRFGNCLQERNRRRARMAISLMQNVESEKHWDLAKRIFVRFLKERNEKEKMKSLVIEFGREAYEYNRDARERLFPGRSYIDLE